ncbi:GntR family transcriptional regulator [Amaricoccus sp.]|uniref:GntR family transcriptional regulator n=1 Tax=Amaricoccus sp. TaxID=1872485 RepID=UPI001B53EADD|nr:GntR family transcriptional regulator [Amaricoccus sp.]MBP7242130.1 GntR family transcriptional regulator [Amaricoccus sp.]
MDALLDMRLDRTRPLREQVYAVLRERILTGGFEPGAAVDEKAIATRLQVSRTPVHEAVKKLADEGLLQVRAQSGTTVAPLDRRQIEQAHVIRRALEGESARQAALRITPAWLNRLADIQLLHAAAIERRAYADAIAQDDAFHRTITEISDYPMLWRAIEISKAQLDRCRHLTIPLEGRGAATLAEHQAIVDALGRGDPEDSAAAMRRHLDGAQAKTLEYLDALLAEPAQ